METWICKRLDGSKVEVNVSDPVFAISFCRRPPTVLFFVGRTTFFKNLMWVRVIAVFITRWQLFFSNTSCFIDPDDLDKESA